MKKSIIVKENQYTKEELIAIEHLVKKEKSKGKIFKSEKEFSDYIRELTK